MRETAADLETKARGFGRLRNDITAIVRRQAEMDLLLCCVSRLQPGTVPECPLQLCVMLAELLDAVC